MPRTKKNGPSPSLTEETILLTGDATRRRRVKRTLDGLSPPVESKSWSTDLVEAIEPPVAAIILAAPIVDVPLIEALRTIRKRRDLASVPVFAIVDSGLDDAESAKLYGRGISAVIGWPHEARVFPRLLVETIAAHHVRGAPKSSDKALARLIRAHVKLLPGHPSSVTVDVHRGIVFLSGSIRTLWQKRDAIRSVGNVMGVRSVIADNLTVSRSAKSDRQLLQSIRNVLKATHGVDYATISPTVRNGYVTIAGTVESPSELARLEEVLAHVDGVRGIEKLTTVSPQSKSSHRGVAKRLATRLSDMHPDQDVDVSYFAGVAVLSGRARSLRDRRAIVSTVSEDEAVSRVVDKIDV